MARQVLENGVILPAEYSDDWYDDMTSNLTKLDDVIGSDSEKLSSADVGAAALSNNYNDLDNLPTIPTVNDATLTIQKNGVDVQTFTANASSNVTCNITVPTKTSDITNDSNFVDTSNPAVSSGITSAKVTDYDTHIADTDIHVTTADKNRWNNQTYVFRYSSTALVASSTNANSLLDNTDNLKVGDKVIDSNGVLFSITAIDTANSTFTIGTALIDLAQDSDVVHKSGNETVGGIKTFSNDLRISKISPFCNVFSSGYIKGQAPTSNIYSGVRFFDDIDSGSPNNITGGFEVEYNRDGYNKSYISSRNYAGENHKVITVGLRVPNDDIRSIDFLPSVNGIVNLGTSTNKWKSFNGLNPGALGMPDLSNGIDISSYLTTGNSNNTYTPSANGWISISISASSGGLAIFLEQGDMKVSSYSVTGKYQDTNISCFACLPVVSGMVVNIGLKGSGNYINSAKFFPCLGNV